MKKILLYLIRFYRKYLSPMKVYTHCIYIPTCSEYALEAIEKYGAFKGGLLTVWRILRCNPFAKGGYDRNFNDTGQHTNHRTGCLAAR